MLSRSFTVRVFILLNTSLILFIGILWVVSPQNSYVYLSEDLVPGFLRRLPSSSDSGNIQVALSIPEEPHSIPPIYSQEHKMYPDLRFCATKPLVTFAQQRGNYTVLENYIPAGKSFRCHESITYTTHSEYSFLHNVDNIVDRWQGPVSVAVYTPGTDFERALKTILYLRNCMSEDIKTYVSFHVFYHKDHKPEKIPLPEDVMSMNSDCSSGLPDWTNVTTYRRQNKLLYPVNVGRNAARLAAQTYFVFPSDVELYPSIKVIPEFFKMLRTPDATNTSNPRVYVLPIFEVRHDVEAPKFKSDLQTMLKEKKAVFFHKSICATCHKVPKYDEWVNEPMKSNLSVFHVAKRKPPFQAWEPIYIGTNKDPLFDERFSWEGKSDKMAQMYIMCIRDYEFHILDNAFLVHSPGIKVYRSDRERDGIVARQNNMKSRIVRPEYTKMYGTKTYCHL